MSQWNRKFVMTLRRTNESKYTLHKATATASCLSTSAAAKSAEKRGRFQDLSAAPRVCDSALVHVTSCSRGYTYTRSAARTILPCGRKLPKRKRSGLLTKRCPRCRKKVLRNFALCSSFFPLSPRFCCFLRTGKSYERLVPVP